MNIAQLLSPERVAHGVQTGSRKRALELLGKLIVGNDPMLSEQEVFEGLMAREKLGGTGLGWGIALPHARLKNLRQASGAFIQLASGIDFDANDKQPVNLLFALVVPEKSTDEHLQILSSLAAMFSDRQLREQLREADSSHTLFELLTQWQPHI
jgi:PTS system nitrogen regulatory IIA component